MTKNDVAVRLRTRAIETFDYPFEELSVLAERESFRKEVFRPVYHIHKWWAQRLGSVFRGLAIGALEPADAEIMTLFYDRYRSDAVIFDPFMGSGTSVGEALKLGATAIGRDINRVAVRAVRAALTSYADGSIEDAYGRLEASLAPQLRALYSDTRTGAEVLYYFWVMVATCGKCGHRVDLFTRQIFAQHAYPSRHRRATLVCPACGTIETTDAFATSHTCSSCRTTFNPQVGPASPRTFTCPRCQGVADIAPAVSSDNRRPSYRMYAKLVAENSGAKYYLRTDEEDIAAYERASGAIVTSGAALPKGTLEPGRNTDQVIRYGFRHWADFYNDRQLLALGQLANGIRAISDPSLRVLFACLLSGTAEFNNLLASYKGEGTGAVRHAFAHHILRPEKMPIEANVWGTPRSSGSFSTLFRTRLLRAVDYARRPFEIRVTNPGKSVRVLDLSVPMSREPAESYHEETPRGAAVISCGDSANTGLPAECVDLVLTDPPFFDNVHYSELADFFAAWQDVALGEEHATTRSPAEVQHGDASEFSSRLLGVLREAARVLRRDSLLVFTYHHSRSEGWLALGHALRGAGFSVVAVHPIRSEMAGGVPKRQASAPILFDIVFVCRRSKEVDVAMRSNYDFEATVTTQVRRLNSRAFRLGLGDVRVIAMAHALDRSLAANSEDWTSVFAEASASALELASRVHAAQPEVGAASQLELIP